jgi:NTE family protein
MKKIKVGLALGSGGAKGLSHIGVIKVLEENNIPIDFIAGSSIGALIGGVYAASKNIRELEEVVLSTDWKKIFSLIDPAFKGGLLGGDKVKNFIKKYIGKENFEELLIPFSAVATNIQNGKPVIFSKGDVATAIRASISFPLLFRMVKSEGDVLADGGLSLPVPVSVVKDMGADVVIAVNLDGGYFNEEHQRRKMKFYDIANNSLNILRYHLATHNSEEADVVVLPKTGDVYWNKFVHGENVISSGEKAMQEKIKDLKKIIEG